MSLPPIKCKRCNAEILPFSRYAESRLCRDHFYEPFELDSEPADPLQFSCYEIVGIIKQGGMGDVFLARHEHLERMEAIKVVSSKWNGSPAKNAFVDSLIKEAQSVAKLDHSGIVKINFADRVDSEAYFVMEYLDGWHSLNEMLNEIPCDARIRLDIVKQIIDAIEYAHSEGVFHHDIAPRNVLVSNGRHGWRVKIIDFGLAAALRSSELEFSVQNTDEYLAPELSPKTHCPVAVDIYGIGQIAKLLLNGIAVSTPTRQLFEQCLSPSPASRPSSVHELSLQLASHEQRAESSKYMFLVVASCFVASISPVLSLLASKAIMLLFEFKKSSRAELEFPFFWVGTVFFLTVSQFLNMRLAQNSKTEHEPIRRLQMIPIIVQSLLIGSWALIPNLVTGQIWVTVAGAVFGAGSLFVVFGLPSALIQVNSFGKSWRSALILLIPAAVVAAWIGAIYSLALSEMSATSSEWCQQVFGFQLPLFLILALTHVLLIASWNFALEVLQFYPAIDDKKRVFCFWVVSFVFCVTIFLVAGKPWMIAVVAALFFAAPFCISWLVQETENAPPPLNTVNKKPGPEKTDPEEDQFDSWIAEILMFGGAIFGFAYAMWCEVSSFEFNSNRIFEFPLVVVCGTFLGVFVGGFVTVALSEVGKRLAIPRAARIFTLAISVCVIGVWAWFQTESGFVESDSILGHGWTLLFATLIFEYILCSLNLMKNCCRSMIRRMPVSLAIGAGFGLVSWFLIGNDSLPIACYCWIAFLIHLSFYAAAGQRLDSSIGQEIGENRFCFVVLFCTLAVFGFIKGLVYGFEDFISGPVTVTLGLTILAAIGTIIFSLLRPGESPKRKAYSFIFVCLSSVLLGVVFSRLFSKSSSSPRLLALGCILLAFIIGICLVSMNSRSPRNQISAKNSNI